MKSFSRSAIVFTSLLGVFASTSALAETLRFELLATEKGTVAGGLGSLTAITPTADLTVAPGDLVRVDVFISDWSPNEELLKAWQLSIDSTTFEDAASGEWGLEPWGYNGDQLAREEGAFIESTRSDYVYLGLAELPAVDVSTDIYRYGSAAINTSQFPCVSDDCNADPCGPFPQFQCRDDLPKYYLGSLLLIVLDDASGGFELRFRLKNMYAIDENARRICDQNGDATYQTNEVQLDGITLIVVEDQCGDGQDNDADNLVDCADPDCNGRACDDGNACSIGETCSGGVCGQGQPAPDPNCTVPTTSSWGLIALGLSVAIATRSRRTDARASRHRT